MKLLQYMYITIVENLTNDSFAGPSAFRSFIRSHPKLFLFLFFIFLGLHWTTIEEIYIVTFECPLPLTIYSISIVYIKMKNRPYFLFVVVGRLLKTQNEFPARIEIKWHDQYICVSGNQRYRPSICYICNNICSYGFS